MSTFLIFVTVVVGESVMLMERDTDRFDENYGLASTQSLKNKDIPEGGAKGTILPSYVSSHFLSFAQRSDRADAAVDLAPVVFLPNADDGVAKLVTEDGSAIVRGCSDNTEDKGCEPQDVEYDRAWHGRERGGWGRHVCGIDKIGVDGKAAQLHRYLEENLRCGVSWIRFQKFI